MSGIPVPLVRANQLFLVGAIILALLVRQPWVVVGVLAVAAVALAGGPRVHPVFLVARPLLGPRLAAAEREDARMQRFNQLLATVLLAVSSGFLLGGWTLAGWIVAGLLAAVALAGALGFCLGCRLYRWVGPWMRVPQP